MLPPLYLIMITCYFACPGSGKTCTLACIALKELKRIKKGKSKYNRIYTNFNMNGTYKIQVKDLGKYLYTNSLILLDEVTLELDSRDWKIMSQGIKEYITLHRHTKSDIVYCCQDWSRAEKTLRNCTEALYFLKRSHLPILKYFVKAKCIYRKLSINEYIGDLIYGYRFSDIIDRIIDRCDKVYFIKKAFKHINSYDLLQLAERPLPPLNLWSPAQSDAVPESKEKNESIKNF